jgi:hypothetical protein
VGGGYLRVLEGGAHKYIVYGRGDNASAHKKRKARTDSETELNGRDAAFEVGVEEAELCVPDGALEAEVGIEAVENWDTSELEEEEEEEDLGCAVDNEGNGGRDGFTLPTVMVVPLGVAEVWEKVVGMGMVEVAAARGEENEPDIPLRLS